MSETGRYRQPDRERAEAIGLAALAFLASDSERLDRFLALSGLDAGDIRTAAAQPGFLGGVLQHIMDDDRIASAFATDEGLKPDELMAAATALGAHSDWDLP